MCRFYNWGRGLWGGEDVGNFPRGLPHDVCFKYTFISVVLKINQENIQERDHELLVLTELSLKKKLTLMFDIPREVYIYEK